MIWLALLKRFWVLIPLTAGLLTIVFVMHRLETRTQERDQWRQKAEAALQLSAEWQASFRQSESLRKNEQEGAVQAVNASEASCDSRVQSARESSIKIEKIVTKRAECRPGESISRSMVPTADLAASLDGL